MYKIALVNMPMASLAAPSLALTQLRFVAMKAFGDRVSVEIDYLNQDFAHYMTPPAYHELNSFEHHPTGLAEWFFREAAFPGIPDNTEEYFRRHYPQHDPHNRMIRQFVLQKREGLEAHFDEMIDKYGLDRVDLVGFTSMFAQNVATLAMARRVKERNPGVVVVMGGANCEAPMGREIVDHVPAVDFVFSGPSLKSFPELVRCLMEGDEAGCHRLNGVFSRRNQIRPAGCSSKSDMVTLGGPAAFTVGASGDELDINEPVELDYGRFLDMYEASFPDEPQPVLFFETSRGCWWGERAHCTFCGLNGSTINYRAMKPELAFRLLDSLFQHESRCAELSSVDNILPKSYLTDVLPFLDTPSSMEIFYEVKADLAEESFRVLQKSRVLKIQPGIEALNTSTLKLMRKGTSAFQNLQFLINCLRYGIHPSWNLLIGFPGEEIQVYEKYLEDLPLLTHLPPPSGVFPIRFDRFSPYYDEAESYGLALHPLDWYDMTYPFGSDVLMNLAYYFSDHNFAAPYAMHAARMVAKLRTQVDRWTTMWNDSEKRPQLRLGERNGETTVYDSRSGAPVEYSITRESRVLLSALSTAKKLSALTTELEDLDVAAELEILRARELIFHEGERFMSLVVSPRVGLSGPVAQIDRAVAAV
ncbi:MAG TPA: RiPP maturation radical SAM C-methyltransferase [Longimicrobiaceae bacterium]|nr:RiPP maturation radical SAM C-methyltransferase [Longimicrobiaceae bacterium]